MYIEQDQRAGLNNLEAHFHYILKYCNFNFYNVGKTYCLQLFDKEIYANDQVDCIAEFDNESMSLLFSQAIEWIDDYLKP